MIEPFKKVFKGQWAEVEVELGVVMNALPPSHYHPELGRLELYSNTGEGRLSFLIEMLQQMDSDVLPLVLKSESCMYTPPEEKSSIDEAESLALWYPARGSTRPVTEAMLCSEFDRAYRHGEVYDVLVSVYKLSNSGDRITPPTTEHYPILFSDHGVEVILKRAEEKANTAERFLLVI